MIVDVHSHTPRFRDAASVPTSLRAMASWRPDQPNRTAYTWDDYLAAMKPVDRAICFNIAAGRADVGHKDDGGLIDQACTINDETSTFVRAHPGKLIGFLTVHPDDPHMLDEVERATSDLGLR